jgi:hypothetical protein
MENGRTQIVGGVTVANTVSPMQRKAPAHTARLRAGTSQALHELRVRFCQLRANAFHTSLVEKVDGQK